MMMTLQNIGLVSLNNAPDAFHTIIKTFQIQEDVFCIKAKGYDFMFENIVMPFKLELPAYFLTKEGQVIFNMLDVPMIPPEYESVIQLMGEILDRFDNETKVDRTTAFKAVLRQIREREDEDIDIYGMAAMLSALLEKVLEEEKETQ